MAGKSRSTAALITEKGWTKACMRWAGKDPQQSVRHLADASQAAYEYSLLEGESYLPKRRLAGYDQAIRRKEVKDAKTYRNVATAYLTLERLLEGRAPGRRERRQAEHLEKAFCTAYKKAAEDYILSRQQQDKLIYILRPCMIHGPGVKGNLNLLVNIVKKGIPWPLAAFENKRSFASIGNVSFIIDRLLKSEIHSDIYNICDDNPVSTNELISIICGCMGKKTHLWKVPVGIVRIGAKIGDMFHLPLNSERLGKLTENYIVDNSKIKICLGADKMPIRAIDGLRSTISYMIKKQ